MFKHEWLPDNKLEQINSDHGRYYQSEDGYKFYSVTTLLGMLSKDPAKEKSLQNWKDWVGEEKASRILTQAGYRGTIVHDALEKFLRNDPDPTKGMLSINRETVRPLFPILAEHVSKVFGLEHRLYSKKLRCSGTADCIALWDGELAVIDFKTARSNRNEEDITDYFLQSTAYALMCHERHGIIPRKIVIVMAIDHDKPKVFVQKTSKYARTVAELFAQAPEVA